MSKVTRANAPARPAPARVVALVRSGDAALVEEVARRLDYEFGILPVELSSAEAQDERRAAGAVRWLALDRIVEPSTLPDLENHGLRISALFGGDDGEREEGPSVDINFGLVSANRVIRAERFDKPDCIYLGGGIWAELVCMRDADAEPWIMQSEIDPHWSGERAREFLSSAADLDGTGASAEAARA